MEVSHTILQSLEIQNKLFIRLIHHIQAIHLHLIPQDIIIHQEHLLHPISVANFLMGSQI